ADLADLRGTARRAKLLEEVSVDLEVVLPLLGGVVLVVDRLNWADGLASAAVHALVRVDVKHALALVDAVHRALFDACLVEHINACLRDDVGHLSSSLTFLTHFSYHTVWWFASLAGDNTPRSRGRVRLPACFVQPRGPLVPGVADLRDPVRARVGDEPVRHGPACAGRGGDQVSRSRTDAGYSGQRRAVPLPRRAEHVVKFFRGPVQVELRGDALARGLLRRVVPAGDRVRCGDVVGGEQRSGLRVLLVGVAGGTLLHGLRGLIDRNGRVAGYLDERTEEGLRGVRGILQLRGASPALRRPLLEDADRVPVAVGQVLQLGLLERGRVSDGQRPAWQALADGYAGDGGRVGRLPEIERYGVVAGARLAARDRQHLGKPLVDRVSAVSKPRDQRRDQRKHDQRTSPRGAPVAGRLPVIRRLPLRS